MEALGPGSGNARSRKYEEVLDTGRDEKDANVIALQGRMALCRINILYWIISMTTRDFKYPQAQRTSGSVFSDDHSILVSSS